MADEPVARRWLIGLGRLTAARSSHDEVADFLDACTPALASRFPNAAFNPVSLEAVAAECKYLPAYGELVPLLSAWWRQNRPHNPALPAPSTPTRPSPTDEEIEAVHRSVVETVAILRSRAQPAEDRRPVARYLNRRQLNSAYQAAGIVGPREAQ